MYLRRNVKGELMQVWMFDIDGTLIVSGGAGQDAAVRAIESVFQIPASREGIPFAGRTDRAIIQDLFAAHQIEVTPENRDRFQAAYLHHLDRLLKERAGRVLEGVSDLIAHLQCQPDTYLGLLTGNVRAGAKLKLVHYGLWNEFAFGGYGDQHLARADVARTALDAAQAYLLRTVSPLDIWVVGDTVNDILCARAIGARVIAVATGDVSADQLAVAQPDVLVEHLGGFTSHPVVNSIG